jgi:hypothetical protein
MRDTSLFDSALFTTFFFCSKLLGMIALLLLEASVVRRVWRTEFGKRNAHRCHHAPDGGSHELERECSETKPRGSP